MAKNLRNLVFLAPLLAAPAAAQSAYTPPQTVISDNITYTVHWDGSYTYEEAITLRLNTENAVQNGGQAYIYDNGPTDRITILNAYTTTPAGNRIDVLPSQILDQPSGDDQDGMYSNAGRKVLIFPSLSPGAMLHYHYIIAANGTYFPGQFFAEEVFTKDNATQSATVTVTAPAALKLFFQAYLMQGGQVTDTKPGQSKWVYATQNVPAQPPEDGSEDVTDFSPRMEVTSFPDYASVGAAYEQNAGPQAAVTSNVQQLADTITRNLSTPRARAVALYNWVSQNIRYVAVSLGYNGYTPTDADDILATGYGDCKDHVTLLRALLAAEHINSSGAMVNLGQIYFTPKIAVPAFDHIITFIPQFNVFVDSTAQIAPFGVLPNEERGKLALLTGAPGVAPRLVTLPLTSAALDVAHETTTASIAPDGTVTGVTTIANSGRYELEDREAFDRLTPGTAAARAAQMLADYGEQGAGDVTALTPPDDLTKPFVVTGHFTLPLYSAMPGPATLPLPLGLPHGLVYFERLTALPARTLPQPCLPQDILETTTLRFPPGIPIKSIPPATNVINAIGAYTSSYARQGQTVRAERHLLTHTAGAVCSPAEYLQLRDLSFAIGRDLRAAIVY